MQTTDDQVPQPPHFERQFRIPRLQLIGVPLLALLPLLAIFGLFGDAQDRVRTANEDIALEVEYVTRYRYRMEGALQVYVTNLSAQSPATVTVALDRAYLEHFSGLSFVPDVDFVTQDAYYVHLSALAPGETRLVMVEIQGDHYWTQSGVISASLSGGQPISVPVSTTIFP